MVPSSSQPILQALLALQLQDCDLTGLPAGSQLSAGSKLAFQRGLLEVVLDGGATTIVQGPAEIELESPSSLRLMRGSLTADVPATAHGFTVHTPNAAVVDLGTRFGVACQAEQTDVEVFVGNVILRLDAAASGAGPKELPLAANSAARISGQPGHGALKIEQLAAGSRQFVQSMIVPASILAPACDCPDVPQAAADLVGTWHSPSGNIVPIDLSAYSHQRQARRR